MKKILLVATFVLSFGLSAAFGQFGPHGGGQGPRFDGALDKLFGNNQSFSATLEFRLTSADGDNVVMPGKIDFDSGKTRFDMNLSETQGTKLPPGAADQMKSMGMDNLISISRPDLKLAYLVYPGLDSYAEMASQDDSANNATNDYKVETVEAGKETVDGHDCVKNKVTVTGKDGKKHEFTVWNATDLKNFPIKIETSDSGQPVAMTYKNVSFTKPDAGKFEAPSGFTKYSNAETMVRTEMMKRIGGAFGRPPGQ